MPHRWLSIHPMPRLSDGTYTHPPPSSAAPLLFLPSRSPHRSPSAASSKTHWRVCYQQSFSTHRLTQAFSDACRPYPDVRPSAHSISPESPYKPPHDSNTPHPRSHPRISLQEPTVSPQSPYGLLYHHLHRNQAPPENSPHGTVSRISRRIKDYHNQTIFLRQ